MSFLVDTNVVSEWVKPRPHPGVIDWLAGADEDEVFLSVVTLAELRHGIERLPAGRRQKQLSAWLEVDLAQRFEGRIVGIDPSVADMCGRIVAKSEGAGRRLEAMDAFLAATAQVYDLTLVTRNIADFHALVRHLLNPWS